MTPAINGQTKVFAALSEDEDVRGFSDLYNASFQELGANAVYLPMKVVDLGETLAALRTLHVQGFTVSRPFKLAVIPYLDALASSAREVGAVNTVVNEHGRWIGHNTDAYGTGAALQEVVSPGRWRAAILGTGGAARAAAVALRRAGATVDVFGRSLEAARAFASSLGCTEHAVAELAPPAEWEILVNATPVGGVGRARRPAFSSQLVRRARVVVDFVIDPPLTPLIRLARRCGVGAVPGTRILLHQADLQIKLFFGAAAPMARLEAALDRILRRPRSFDVEVDVPRESRSDRVELPSVRSFDRGREATRLGQGFEPTG